MEGCNSCKRDRVPSEVRGEQHGADLPASVPPSRPAEEDGAQQSRARRSTRLSLIKRTELPPDTGRDAKEATFGSNVLLTRFAQDGPRTRRRSSLLRESSDLALKLVQPAPQSQSTAELPACST